MHHHGTDRGAGKEINSAKIRKKSRSGASNVTDFTENRRILH